MPKDTTSQVVKKEETNRLGKIRLSFLYILIGGLVTSAVISVIAILIGEFNDIVQKALATTFVVVIHSLMVLAIVSADKRNQLGKSLLPTTILSTVIASIFTSTFGIWQLWQSDASSKAFCIYLLVIGAAYLVTGSLKLRINHKATLGLLYGTIGLTALLTLVLIPWIVLDSTALTDFYFRAVAAITILGVTSITVGVIVRRIAIAQKHSLLQTRPKVEPVGGGMLAILITVGVIICFAWMVGFSAFVYQSVRANYDPSITYPAHDSYYDGYYR